MRKISTLSALFSGLIILSGCVTAAGNEQTIQTRVVEEARAEPIVPNIDQLDLETVDWKVVTPENVDQVFASLTGREVLFAVDDNGYRAIAANMTDLRAALQQQQSVIAVYRESFR